MVRKIYRKEYKTHLVKLVQAGSSPVPLAKEYEPSVRESFVFGYKFPKFPKFPKSQRNKGTLPVGK